MQKLSILLALIDQVAATKLIQSRLTYKGNDLSRRVEFYVKNDAHEIKGSISLYSHNADIIINSFIEDIKKTFLYENI